MCEPAPTGPNKPTQIKCSLIEQAVAGVQVPFDKGKGLETASFPPAIQPPPTETQAQREGGSLHTHTLEKVEAGFTCC